MPLIKRLAQRADAIKLNNEEVGRLTSWLKTGETMLNTPRSTDPLAEASLAEATDEGGQGSGAVGKGNLVCAPAAKVVVRDTVGAGDAVTAGLKVLPNACLVGALRRLAQWSGAITPGRDQSDVQKRLAALRSKCKVSFT